MGLRGPHTPQGAGATSGRHFYEIAQGGDAPIGEAALRRIAALFGIERTIRGQAPEQRRAVRLAQTTPLIDDLRVWLEAMLAKVSGGSRIARAIRYALKHWAGSDPRPRPESATPSLSHDFAPS